LNLDDAVADRSQGFGAAWPSGAPATRHLATVLVKTETWRPQLSLWLTRSPSLSLSRLPWQMSEAPLPPRPTAPLVCGASQERYHLRLCLLPCPAPFARPRHRLQPAATGAARTPPPVAMASSPRSISWSSVTTIHYARALGWTRGPSLLLAPTSYS